MSTFERLKRLAKALGCDINNMDKEDCEALIDFAQSLSVFKNSQFKIENNKIKVVREATSFTQPMTYQVTKTLSVRRI